MVSSRFPLQPPWKRGTPKKKNTHPCLRTLFKTNKQTNEQTNKQTNKTKQHKTNTQPIDELKRPPFGAWTPNKLCCLLVLENTIQSESLQTTKYLALYIYIYNQPWSDLVDRIIYIYMCTCIYIYIYVLIKQKTVAKSLQTRNYP